MRSLTATVLIAASVLGPAATRAETAPVMTVEGTNLRVVTDGGAVLRSPDLVGAVLQVHVGDGEMARVRIDAVTVDPAGGVLLHQFSVEGPSGERLPYCSPDPDGRTTGFPLAGRAGEDGHLIKTSDDDFSIACTSGARGKCVRFGYHPWTDAAALSRYNACLRLVRADYGGANDPFTRDGMLIDLYDDAGVQKPEAVDPMPFEAGWTEHGAVCVAHPRVPENGSLDDIVARYPHLAGRIGPDVCTETAARAWGAVLFNRSRINPTTPVVNTRAP